MNDLINRRKAFEYFVALWECIGTIMDREEWEDVCMTTANEIPSAQPEIIRCKDCKYRDENWRRVSVKWLPCMDVRTGSNWYCGSAEMGEQNGQ